MICSTNRPMAISQHLADNPTFHSFCCMPILTFSCCLNPSDSWQGKGGLCVREGSGGSEDHGGGGRDRKARGFLLCFGGGQEWVEGHRDGGERRRGSASHVLPSPVTPLPMKRCALFLSVSPPFLSRFPPKRKIGCFLVLVRCYFSPASFPRKDTILDRNCGALTPISLLRSGSRDRIDQNRAFWPTTCVELGHFSLCRLI